MIKIVITGLLSALLIWFAPNTPTSPAKINKQEAAKPQVATVEKVQQPTRPQTEKTVAKPMATRAARPVVTPTYPTNCATYEPIVAQYSWNVHVAMAIMQAESGCNPYAISSVALNYDGISDYGLFQIHGRDVLEPSENIAIAYQKYLSQGWQAWSTYNTGAVWRYY